jgi:hypothetical protein
MASIQAPRRHVSIDRDGRCLAMADVEPVTGSRTARASLHVESGHLPVDTCRRLVDAVLDTPEVRQAEHITAFIPRDRAEILEEVRRRCDAVSARPAGASVVVDATRRPDPVDRLS